MKTVIIPLDGSARSDRAVRVGFSFAARAGARVMLLSVADQGDSRSRAAHLARRCAAFEGVAPADSQVLLGPDPADAILEAASAGDALVCMATHGRGAVADAVLGSVAREVVRGAATPVAVVGPRCSSALPPRRAGDRSGLLRRIGRLGGDPPRRHHVDRDKVTGLAAVAAH